LSAAAGEDVVLTAGVSREVLLELVTQRVLVVRELLAVVR
jgi:hypothetical protein